MATTPSRFTTHPQSAWTQQFRSHARALLMRQDIRAACCGGVPVVGRGGARGRSRPTCPGCNDHQPQIGVTRGRRCPTYTGLHSSGRKMLRVTLRTASGRVAGRDAYSASRDDRAGTPRRT